MLRGVRGIRKSAALLCVLLAGGTGLAMATELRVNELAEEGMAVTDNVQTSYTTLQQQSAERFVRRLELSDVLNVVVAEGEFEPRSIGSYSLHLYAREQTPVSEDVGLFLSGVVRQREGVLEQVLIAPLEAAEAPSVIVTMRSVGSGSYLSADAFKVVGNALVLHASIASAPADTDLIKALQASLRASRTK